uniref:Protein JTB n=1 Tax=Phlebotomus kandelakii TaxID=1109342 RepID=A0A6B2EE48_9DIPT
MIETCPRRRMITGISLLVILTTLVLIIESRWTGSPKPKQFVIENNSTCWMKEEYEIIQDCHPCSAFEIASKIKGVCIHTHNKEVLRCKSGETVSRSCDKVAWMDKRNFWTFESLLCVVGILSTLVSFYRQKILDKKVMMRIHRQLHQSV